VKQFIVLCGTIILGVAIYNLIAGPEDGSVISMVSEVWERGIRVRTDTP
jgi:hypothetical protein